MTNFTTFFNDAPLDVAQIINGAPTVALAGFDPADLQATGWAHPGLLVIEPNPSPGELAEAVARSNNYIRMALAIGWVLSLMAACTLTFALAVR